MATRLCRNCGAYNIAREWEFTSEIWHAITGFQGEDDKAPRILKLNEEIGEVSQAYIGYRGLNKRKGFTHTAEDVANELCDVIVTAMVALEDYVIEPDKYFGEFVTKLIERVRNQGS